jgi:3-oxoadipate enol-lactonase
MAVSTLAAESEVSLKAKLNGVEIDYRIEGSGRLLALAHSLGMAGTIFDPLRALLSERARILTWDTRGHGGSQRPSTGWSIQDLAFDLDSLMDRVGAKRAVVGGLSMGGCTAIAFALAHPEKVDGLILMDTTAGYGPEMRAGWEQRVAEVETQGMGPVVPVQLPRWFSDEFLGSSSEAVRKVRERLSANDPSSYAAACRALGAFDAREKLGRIQCPTLILVGADDPATPVAMSEQMHETIPRSELHVLDGLKHLSPVEAPERVAELIATFLASL